MLKVYWETDTVRWIRELQSAGATDTNVIEKVIASIKAEMQLAFEAGRDFQKRYKDEDEYEGT